MSIGALLIILGIVVWLLAAATTIGIVLVVVGVVLLFVPLAAPYPRRWYW